MMSSERLVQRRLVLVIDDDFDTQETLHHRLNAMGFDVVAASSGHHGLVLLGEHASKGCHIDGILLNWKTRGLDAMAVFHKSQQQHAEIPVIVMNSLAHIERIDWSEDMMRIGARDYILKPLDINLLWDKCARHFMPSSR